MDDLYLWSGQEEESRTQLLGKLACEVEGNAAEVCVT